MMDGRMAGGCRVMMGGRGRKRLLCDDERAGKGESGFFYLTF